jgi:hypothetical protein
LTRYSNRYFSKRRSGIDSTTQQRPHRLCGLLTSGMQAYKEKDRSLAVLVGAIRHHEIGIGEGFVKHIPVEAALAFSCNCTCRACSRCHSALRFNFSQYCSSRVPPKSRSAIRHHRLRMAKPTPFAWIVTTDFKNE